MRRVTLSGDAQGDYVVLDERARGVLRVAPKQARKLPKVVALKRTTSVCPTQWEGTLDDGRLLFAHSRRGELSASLGETKDDAVRNSMSDDPLYFEYVEDAPLDFAELRTHLYGLLEFSEDPMAYEGAGWSA